MYVMNLSHNFREIFQDYFQQRKICKQLKKILGICKIILQTLKKKNGKIYFCDKPIGMTRDEQRR